MNADHPLLVPFKDTMLTSGSTSMLSKADTLAVLAKCRPEQFVGIEAFTIDASSDPMVIFVDTECLYNSGVSLSEDLQTLFNSYSESQAGHLAVARRIVEEAPEDEWFCIALE